MLPGRLAAPTSGERLGSPNTLRIDEGTGGSGGCQSVAILCDRTVFPKVPARFTFYIFYRTSCERLAFSFYAIVGKRHIPALFAAIHPNPKTSRKAGTASRPPPRNVATQLAARSSQLSYCFHGSPWVPFIRFRSRCIAALASIWADTGAVMNRNRVISTS